MIVTDRLILRRWRPADATPFATLCADREVMRWLGGGALPPEDARNLLARWDAHVDRCGFGLWAVERRADGQLIGMAGLQQVEAPDHPLAQSIEIAWRLDRAAWGQGYAGEAAAAALMDGFLRHGLDEVLSATARANERSRRVMAAIGLRPLPARDFDHPALPQGHELRPHIVCAIDSRSWMQHLATSARSA
jgi:RimJ/RimL family protein N-acetyltransferase